VLELMSGTGRLSIPLIEAGVRLTCVDSSPAMLNIFRKKLARRHLTATLIEMDVCELALGQAFPLIILPFHSFSEITDAVLQRRALKKIHNHLTENGRFICTLHNPATRLKMADGSQRLVGEFPLEPEGGTLCLHSIEIFDPAAMLVSGQQFYETYDAAGRLQATRVIDICFYIHTATSFERLVDEAGFRIEALYGDYSRADFEPERSPAMIWDLHK
jgi:SAM-dependent methyltransferase